MSINIPIEWLEMKICWFGTVRSHIRRESRKPVEEKKSDKSIKNSLRLPLFRSEVWWKFIRRKGIIFFLSSQNFECLSWRLQISSVPLFPSVHFSKNNSQTENSFHSKQGITLDLMNKKKFSQLIRGMIQPYSFRKFCSGKRHFASYCNR